MFRFIWKWHNKRKSAHKLWKGSSKSPFSEYLGFQSNGLEFSKCQILGQTCTIICWQTRKSWVWEAEFQERVWCLHCGGSFLGFRFHCQSVFKGGWPDLENSKLVKGQKFPKVTRGNPWHAAGAHWHRYLCWHNTRTLILPWQWVSEIESIKGRTSDNFPTSLMISLVFLVVDHLVSLSISSVCMHYLVPEGFLVLYPYSTTVQVLYFSLKFFKLHLSSLQRSSLSPSLSPCRSSGNYPEGY